MIIMIKEFNNKPRIALPGMEPTTSVQAVHIVPMPCCSRRLLAHLIRYKSFIKVSHPTHTGSRLWNRFEGAHLPKLQSKLRLVVRGQPWLEDPLEVGAAFPKVRWRRLHTPNFSLCISTSYSEVILSQEITCACNTITTTHAGRQLNLLNSKRNN
jgi:hypothetical protein